MKPPPSHQLGPTHANAAAPTAAPQIAAAPAPEFPAPAVPAPAASAAPATPAAAIGSFTPPTVVFDRNGPRALPSVPVHLRHAVLSFFSDLSIVLDLGTR